MRHLKSFIVCIVLSLCFLGALPAAVQNNNADSALVRDIENHLIAPCCWTQPISEHESQVAEEMRDQVSAMVSQGMSREAILDFFVKQYGERVLATPRPEGFNRLVYILPWVALLAGAGIVMALLRKFRTPAPAEVPQSQPESRYMSVIEKELKDLER